MDITVKQLLERKGSTVFSIDHAATIQAGAIALKQHGVGSLLVLDGDRLLGILYERDLARIVVAEGLDVTTTLVSNIMCQEFPTIRQDTMASQAMQIINNERVRHLPVIEEGQVFGLISIGDVNNFMLDAQQEDIEHLVGYISGATPISFISS